MAWKNSSFLVENENCGVQSPRRMLCKTSIGNYNLEYDGSVEPITIARMKTTLI